MQVFKRGLILVAVPLVFQLFILVALANVLNNAEAAVDEQLRLTRLMTRARAVVSSAHDELLHAAAASISGDLTAGMDQRRDNATAGVLSLLRKDSVTDRERQFIEDLSEQWRKTTILKEATHFFAGESKIQNLHKEEKSGLFNVVRIRMRRLTDASDALIDDARSAAARYAEARRKEQKHLALLMIGGLLGSILIAIALAGYASKNLKAVINRLQENSTRLGKGQELMPPLTGTDELSHLDRVINRISTTLNNSRLREEAMFNSAPDIIFSLDESKNITRINAAMDRLLHFNGTEVRIQQLDEIVVGGEYQNVIQLLDSTRTAPNCQSTMETRFKTSAGEERNFLLSVRWEPSQSSYYCVAHDITDKKRLDEAKQDFAAMLSHDLRSPLTSLNAAFDLFIRGFAGNIPPALVEIFELGKKGISRLISLINELLDFEKLEAGQMILDKRPVSVATLIKGATDTIRALAEEKQIAIDVRAGAGLTLDSQVMADEERMVRVLINLLSNGIHFSPAGGRIVIEARQECEPDIEAPGGNALRMEISDQGPGMSEDLLPHVFDRYRQGPQSRQGHGTGLGLAICKQIVEAHGGKIGATSSLGQGSKFWFTIKRAGS